MAALNILNKRKKLGILVALTFPYLESNGKRERKWKTHCFDLPMPGVRLIFSSGRLSCFFFVVYIAYSTSMFTSSCFHFLFSLGFIFLVGVGKGKAAWCLHYHTFHSLVLSGWRIQFLGAITITILHFHVFNDVCFCYDSLTFLLLICFPFYWVDAFWCPWWGRSRCPWF